MARRPNIWRPTASKAMSPVCTAQQASGSAIAKSGRMTFASRLVAQGRSLDTVQLLLGNSHLDHVSPYLEVSAREQREAMAAFDDDCD